MLYRDFGEVKNFIEGPLSFHTWMIDAAGMVDDYVKTLEFTIWIQAGLVFSFEPIRLGMIYWSDHLRDSVRGRMIEKTV